MTTNFSKIFIGLLAVVFSLPPVVRTAQAAERFKPFVLAQSSPGTIATKIREVKESLEDADFTIAGEYSPYSGAYVFVFTSNALKKAAARSRYGGFATAQRVAITRVGDEIQVSYTNPEYMAYAYRLGNDLSGTQTTLQEVLGANEMFGSTEGLTRKELNGYRYTFGMEHFDDFYELAEYGSYHEALKAVEGSLTSNDLGIRSVYRIDIPGKEETIIGISRKAPEQSEKHYDDEWLMTENIDLRKLKGTAYLPYEVMITGNRVVALHMRFRMPVYYPDLKMAGKNSFMNVMPKAEANRKVLAEAVAGKSD